MADFVTAQITNAAEFQAALRRAQSKVSDLTIPLILIAKDFYKSQKAMFQLKGPGQYEDLSPGYKKQKKKAVGFVYPILKRSGALERSVTTPTDSNSINQIIDKNTLIIGTKVKYAAKHQFGQGVPLRPFLFVGPESRFATNEQSGRLGRWKNILEQYVLQATSQEVGS